MGKMRKTNFEIDAMVYAMRPLLERKGLVGMVAARNTRVMCDTIQEYASTKAELIRKHGSESVSEDGTPTGEIHIEEGGDAFREFMAELEPYASMSHEIDVMTVPVRDVMSDLTGSEMLALEWMLED